MRNRIYLFGVGGLIASLALFLLGYAIDNPFYFLGGMISVWAFILLVACLERTPTINDKTPLDDKELEDLRWLTGERISLLDPKTIPSCLLIISSMGILSGVIALVQGMISNYGWVGIIFEVVGVMYWSTELIKIRNKELLNDRRTES